MDGLDGALALLRAESDENACRKEFTPSDAAAIGKTLEQLEKPKARARQKRTQAKGKSKDGQPLIGSGNLPPPTEETETGRTRDKVAEAVGMSGRTFEKAKAVTEAAEENPELFGLVQEKMDRTGKVDPAFKKV